MSRPEIDVAIIGGGVVGLTCAYELASKGRSVMVFERHGLLGQETSTHNSGVIHAGIYYETGSLKARLCVEGKTLLVQRLKEWKVPHRISGKLIVAVDPSEESLLEGLLKQGQKNGVDDLCLIDAEKIKALEPNINGTLALHSPATGVFDVGEYLRALEIRARGLGAEIVPNAEVIGIERADFGLTIHIRDRGAITARSLVNCAGLFADRIAKMCGETQHQIYPCRGEYASVIPKRTGLIKGLVYPVPTKLSLGVHLTKTIGDELWLGPTARYIDSKTDYESDRLAPEKYLESAQRLCPALTIDDLRLGPSGIRPKRYGPDEAAVDFFIAPQQNDPRIVHLVGIESPGLTASAAIGRMVCDVVEL